ncbi:MAG: OmpP1/FadL family transporter [Paludibacteraceae bacterium]
MRKSILILSCLLLGITVSAQTEYDALRMAQPGIFGTARYMSMGGAFGALGGDASALKDNPGGLGVYRSGEISATLSGMFQSANADWYGQQEAAISGLNLKFNHFAYIMSVPLWEERTRGLLQSNFSFTYNRVKNFNRTMTAKGRTDASFTDFLAGFTAGLYESDLKYVEDSYDPYNNVNIPWLSVLAYDGYLIDNVPTNSTSWQSSIGGMANSTSLVFESGGISEYSFGWGGNFNNNLFIGANLNFSDLSYSLSSLLKERFDDGSSFGLNSELRQSGVGVNLKLGAIYLPTNNLRLGFSFHTPTYYSISEWVNYTNLDFNHVGYGKQGYASIPSEGARQNFNLRTPLQTQVSAAYLFGRKGLISLEYNFVNYTGMKFSDENGSREAFRYENDGMKDVLRNGHIMKVGGEFKPSPNWALRAGYALTTSPSNPAYTGGKALRLNTVNTNTEYFEQNGITNYISAGAGYREASWFIDLSYQLRILPEDFYPYQFNRNDLQGAFVKTNTSNIALTVGFKM